MSQRDPIWITGIGALTPVGASFRETSEQFIAGRTGIRAVAGFDVAEHPCRVAGQVLDVPCPPDVSPQEFARCLPLEQCALWCCRQAFDDAGLWDQRHDLRVGVVLGLGAEWTLTWDHDVRRGGERIFHAEQESASIAAQLLDRFGLTGPRMTLAAACASANHALAHARDWLRLGIVDVCLAGGLEMGVTPYSLASFGNLRALSRRNDEPEKALRPFDRQRDGMVLGEGGAVFVLQRAADVRRRRANAYAEVAGFGATSDAHHMVIPSPEPAQGIAAMQQALDDAGSNPDDIDYINAHATGTPVGDVVETRILHGVMGERVRRVPVSSTKSMTGHMLSAAAAVEALACVTAIHYGVIPPTVNLDEIDPQCDLCHVPNQAREQKVRAAISNSFGFGGNNTSLVLRAVA
jgi:3-oxoacyl-[acyl-carrier-protein] synthase II